MNTGCVAFQNGRIEASRQGSVGIEGRRSTIPKLLAPGSHGARRGGRARAAGSPGVPDPPAGPGGGCQAEGRGRHGVGGGRPTMGRARSS
eukprot:4486256-Pyramimonas_sp.AAC.1